MHAGLRSPLGSRKVVKNSKRWILPALACALFTAGVVVFRPLEPSGLAEASVVSRGDALEAPVSSVFGQRQAVNPADWAANGAPGQADSNEVRIAARGQRIDVEVIDALGDPLAGASVEFCLPLLNGSPSCLAEARTDARGRCAFDSLAIMEAERATTGAKWGELGSSGYRVQLAGVFSQRPTLLLPELPAGGTELLLEAPLCETLALELSDGQRDLVVGDYMAVARAVDSPGEPTQAPDLRATFESGRAEIGPIERGQLLELRVHDVHGERLDGPAAYAVADPGGKVRLYLGPALPRVRGLVLDVNGRPHTEELACVLSWKELGATRSASHLLEPDSSGRFELPVPLSGADPRNVTGELFATGAEPGERPLAQFEVEMQPEAEFAVDAGHVVLGADGWK